MNNEITIHLNASHMAILDKLNSYERGVVLSTIFSLMRGSVEADGLKLKDGEYDTACFAKDGVAEDRYDALMVLAEGIVDGMGAHG
jgi:hypothetical protein